MIKNKTSFLVVLFIIFSMLVCKYKAFEEQDKTNPYPISWDVYGYYLYLPATFIHHDLGLENHKWLEVAYDKYKPSSSVYQYTNGKGNRQVIIYNIGYAFIYAPGFFIANYLAEPMGYEADGFSKPYQYSLVITAFLFTLMGLWMFRKISLLFFSDSITSLVIIAVLVGTNYFYQATYDGTIPHNILFTLNCFIIWNTIKWHEDKKIRHIILLALTLGLATICRPIELIWILIPLFWGVYNKTSLIEKIKLLLKKFKHVFIFGFLLFIVVCIQLFYLKYATGYFRAINLHSEKLSFFDPYTFKFLFSYKKGWLVYTPIMIFGIAGFYFLFKQNKTIWLPLFLFFVINLYVVSSWECWWYASSFAQRAMVETYSMMLFPMGAFFSWILAHKMRLIKYAFALLISACVVLNIFQTWQFLNYIIDREYMTEKYYWKVFGKTAIQDDVRQYLSVDRSQTVFTDYLHYNDGYIKKEVLKLDFENASQNSVDTTSAEGKRAYIVKTDIPFSPGLNKKYYELTNKSYVWIRASVWVYLTTTAAQSNSALVITAESEGRTIKYAGQEIKNLAIQPNKWTQIHVDFLSPEIRHKNDKIIAYYWNMGNRAVLIDDLEVTVYEPKVDYE